MYDSKTEAWIFGALGAIAVLGAAHYLGKRSAEKTAVTETAVTETAVSAETAKMLKD